MPNMMHDLVQEKRAKIQARRLEFFVSGNSA
jgi:hypothetical protein